MSVKPGDLVVIRRRGRRLGEERAYVLSGGCPARKLTSNDIMLYLGREEYAYGTYDILLKADENSWRIICCRGL
jgi:hypothetical protein